MYTKYNYMYMSTIEIFLLYHTLIQVCILNISTCIILLYKYMSTIEMFFLYHTLIQVCVL